MCLVWAVERFGGNEGECKHVQLHQCMAGIVSNKDIYPKLHMTSGPVFAFDEVPEGDLHELGARGHWVSPSLLLWRTAADLPANARVTLHAKAAGKL